MPDDSWVPIAIFATYIALLIGERVAVARDFVPRPGWRWIGWGFLILLFVISGALPALLPMAWIAERALLPGHRLGVVGGVVAGVLTFTFVNYWIHRALHRFDALWRAVHQLHHGAERVDMSGWAVVHPVEIALFAIQGVLVNVLVLGLDPRAVAIAGYLGAIMGMFPHWNIRTPRWLGFIIQRPESHCLHHERHVHGRNYSNLPLWDMVFGTFANPAEFNGEVGFDGSAGRRLGAMLLGRDVNRGAAQPAYRVPERAGSEGG